MNDRLLTKHRSVFDRMMTIVVEDGTEFQMHRGLLCFHSEFFKKLLDGPFKEGGSKWQTLPDVSRNTFTMFYNWIYAGTVENSDKISDADLSNEDIVDIYIFADYHMVPHLKNRALELYFLQDLQKWVVQINPSSRIYNNTTQSSMLRKLYADLLLETYNFEDWREDQAIMPKDLIADLFDTCRRLGVAPGTSYGISGPGKSVNEWIKQKRRDFCAKYHEHEHGSDTSTDAS
jgi:hypothetical protein